MPTAANKLTKQSSSIEIREAISQAIKQLIEEGRDQKQAAAIAYSEAEKATGKKLTR